jgi:hypothetical protein
VRPRRVPVALMLVAGGLVAACGVPVDEAAELRPRGQIPFDLLETTTTPPTSEDGATGEDTVICLELDGALLSVGRERSAARGLDSLEGLAVAPPTTGEAQLGLRSAVDRDVIEAVSLRRGLATVNLDAEFVAQPADQQLLAVAQLTCTLTSQPGVSRVRFRLEGDRIEVPVQGGALVRRAVTRADYERLIAN